MSSLHYEIRGHGPPVLLIQGVGVPASGWRPQVDALHTDFEMVSFDNPGVGQSPLPDQPMSLHGIASTALELMDELGWSSAHVAGHSMGGLIAQALALIAPQRVRSLALLCTFQHGRQAAALTPFKAWMGLRTTVGTRRMRRAAFVEMVLSRRSWLDTDRETLARSLEPIFGRDLADQPPNLYRQMLAMRAFDPTDHVDSLSSIRTWVLSGNDDRVAPPQYGRALAASLGASFECWQDAAHGLTVTHADRVNQRLAQHWSGESAA